MRSSSNYLQRNFGVMNPNDVMRDAETVLEYAKENYIQLRDSFRNVSQKNNISVKVLVHGESLGGMVASYIAM
jgi:hypothetical protein